MRPAIEIFTWANLTLTSASPITMSIKVKGKLPLPPEADIISI
ncbi:MAG: hypothetical protein ACPKQO_10065 [Nitrososphaeraceae archaeon]